MQAKKELLILTPFELPDVALVLKTIKAGAYPLLHLGRNKKIANEALSFLASHTDASFGVCISSEEMADIKLPKNVTKALLPFGIDIKLGKGIEPLYQVYSFHEAEKAIKEKVNAIVLKGNEGAGKVAYETSYVFFQGVKLQHPNCKTDIYIQGGVGVHSYAAFLAMGAKGVILDSQIAMFPECSAPKEIKTICSKLSGNELILVDNKFRVLYRNNSPTLTHDAKYKDLVPYLDGFDLSENYLPMGRDVTLSLDLYERYKKLPNLIAAFNEAAYGHLLQAKSLNIIGENSPMTEYLGTKYPIAQGPMARVSDVPEFTKKVSEAGALPFLAMSMMVGDSAKKMLVEAAEQLKGMPWGVGILGFIPSKIRDEQTKYILEANPPFVLIAGGRPSLAKPFEERGIKTFIHVPSANLLDIFLKEGGKSFIFEGRECGGHVGPLPSLVLWEKQIFRLLKEEDSSSINVFFAGGIHDEFSSAFVSIMSASLAAKGMKVGVLMGTAYLYTEEIVKTGAIVNDYQKYVIEKNETILLEAAPGQETRSIKTPFIDFFLKEKKKMQKEKMDSKEIWIKLEELNLGRARIAAKGVERVGSELIHLNSKEQYEKGLYMTGQVTALIHNSMTIKELHIDVAVKNNELISKLEDLPCPKPNQKPLDIAIVGMSAIFPDAKNLDEYWKNILLGKNSIGEVPDVRWNKELFFNPDTRDTDYVCSKWGGFIPTMDFDPLEFGITPQSLASIEPIQLLSLYAAKRALEDAGYGNLNEVDHENTSVIFGAEGATELANTYGIRVGAKQIFGELPDEVKNSLPRLNEDSFAGILSNVISGRIANRLNLGGRNYTVDAACASSLAALDVGCQELASNKSDMVILGGADFHNGIYDYLMFSCTHALSRKGRSASFDSESDGIVLGEGIGVVILKRLEDAERDGDKIYAVIKGMGGSSDGKSLGMTAPNMRGQIKALERAYRGSGILPSQVELVEAHGTGTIVGDRTELSALTDMFLSSGAKVGQTHVGSVKTQIGHTKCAAGLAGLIKATLAVYHGVKPPTINLTKPNAFYNSKTSPFLFNTQAGLWNSEKRIAGISAFGFGGTNFHTVIENYIPSPSPSVTMSVWPSELFLFRGSDKNEALEEARKIKNLLTINKDISFKDIAYTLATSNKKDIQASIVAENPDQLLAKINALLNNIKEDGIYYNEQVEGKVAFLFSGQGSQRINMARDLFVAFPSMRRLLSQNKEYERIIFPEAAFDDATKKAQQATITDTRNAQPLLGIVDFAIADFLRSLGIEPDMVAGHSYGELPALCFAGVFSPENLTSLSRQRAESILNAIDKDKGVMVAVSAPEEEINGLLKDETEIWAVNFNSAKQIVLAGTTSGMATFMKKMDENKIAYRKIDVACAFHSPLLKKSKELYAEVLKNVPFKSPTVTVWSNTTSEHYPSQPAQIKNRLCEHLIKPVLFTKEVEKMYEEGARIFIETGPGKVLTGLVQSILGNKIETIQTEAKDKDGISFLLNAIAKYIATGRNINIEKLFEDRNVNIVDLNNAEQYKKKTTIWNINGQNAVPSSGKMPADGAYPITKPIKLKTLKMSNNNYNSDEIMMEYLHSVKMMIQTQRDIMLSYFGQSPSSTITYTSIDSSNRAIPAGNQTMQPTNATMPATPSQNEEVVVQEVTNLSFSKEQIKNLLLDVVSDKTGYPIEMLGMDQDLEAELSIDSIKRMEIIGALTEKMNISGSLEGSEELIEKMATIKTLNGLIDWFDELSNSGGNFAGKGKDAKDNAEVVEAVEVITDGDANLARLKFELYPYPLKTEPVFSIKDKKFAITNDGGNASFAKNIKKQLEAEGALAEIISITDNISSYDGVIVLEAKKSPMHYTINEVFSLIKSGDMDRLKWIFTVSDFFADLKDDKINELKNAQGLPGLIKSLNLEYPDISCRALVFHSAFDKKTLPQTIINELKVGDPYAEIIYNGTDRLIYAIKEEVLSLDGEVKLQLDKDAVVIVTGGAQGITPELISQLAAEYPCNYILVGRSSQLSEEDAKYRDLKTKDEIRQYLIGEEHMKVPVEIEKKVQRIYKSNQIGEAISKIEQSGGKVEYRSLDIRNTDELKALIKSVRDKYGRIDGIVHAAGLLDDKLFSSKTLESFDSVYTTKITPFETILDEVGSDLKLLVLFSSVSSSYGNKGQTDYAAANSVFDHVSQALADNGKTRVLTFNWGPWKGAGMVSSALENEFRKRGVSLIPLKEGGEFFVNEIKYGSEPQVLIMAGEEDIRKFLESQM